MSRFHSDERQVERYRVGRVFLAGDAAHVHSPAGGQGMNTGLQDAANLGWKLAAAVQGRAGDRLLDTYHDERHPVGRQVLRSSGLLVRAAMSRSPLRRAARRVLAPAALSVPWVHRRLTGALTGIGISYESADGEDRPVGSRAPDIALHGGGRLYAALRAGRFVLLGTPAADLTGWRDRVEVAAPASATTPRLLVRPDGYVAWAATTGEAGLHDALRRWAGPELTPARPAGRARG
jgi:FAD binding domain